MNVIAGAVDRTSSSQAKIALFRSLSASFWRWLTASAAEFGYEVTTS